MKIYHFSKDCGNAIVNYDSIHSSYTKILKTVEPTNIGFIYIEAGGEVGLHEAPVPQLFIVTQGEGWVYGKEREKLLVKQGDGVYWKEGQAHASGSDTGLTALVIQSTQIDLPV